MAESELQPWQLWFVGIGSVAGAITAVFVNKPETFEGFAITVFVGILAGATLGYLATVVLVFIPIILIVWILYFAYREPWIAGGIVVFLIAVGVAWALIKEWRSESSHPRRNQVEVDKPPSLDHQQRMKQPDGEILLEAEQPQQVAEERNEHPKEALPENPVALEELRRFYSCFISYSFEDDQFARALNAKMEQAGLRVWFAPEDVQGGKKLHEQIEAAIRIHEKLLIVLSEASLQSEWVMTELRRAFKTERQSGKRKLFPVRLVDMKALKAWVCFDADSGKDLAVELREYFIPDFSNWKDHDQFEAAFSRLLKDLRAEEPAK